MIWFPLSSEYKDAAPVNHPALVNISYQPSLSSANFLPFTSAEALWSSEISPLPSLNLKPNPNGATAKKITSSLCKKKKIVETTQKKKIKHPNPVGLRRMLFLVKKTEEKGLPGSNSVWHLIGIGHWPSCSFRWRVDGGRWETRCWLCVLYWSFLSRPQWRRLDTMCEMFQMDAHTLCWYGGRFCLRACHG